MERFTIVIGALLGLQLVLRTLRLQTFPIPRAVVSLGLLALVHWMGSTGVSTAVGLLASWLVSAEIRGLVDPLGGLRKQLKSGDPADLAQAVHAAKEMGTDKANALLLDHLATQAQGEERKAPLVVAHALVEGWGVEVFLARWGVLPPETRITCLEALMGKTGFPAEATLKIARDAMDKEPTVAAAGWRTYASVVTAGFDQQAGGLDPQVWLQQSAGDSNKDVQGLRTHLAQKRTAEVQTQGVDSLVSRYRREVFIHSPETAVRLQVSKAYGLDGEQAGELQLPPGKYVGSLSGKFDNAQNAVAEGWRFHLLLMDVGGKPWELTVIWHAAEFFGEILDERHSAERRWFDEAPEEVERAFATQAFVGPVVSYGDAWSAHKPTIDGVALQLGEKQLLKCLVAAGPSKGDEPTNLSFLLYGVEDAEDPDEELRPFVTTIPLERMVLSASEDDMIEIPTVKVL